MLCEEFYVLLCCPHTRRVTSISSDDEEDHRVKVLEQSSINNIDS